MRALIVYESMFGNTRVVAEHIADGIRTRGDATVVPVEGATPELVAGADLVVVGGPTHAHAMTRLQTRAAARDAAAKDDAIALDPSAAGPGLRDWFHALTPGHAAAAAFDTRVRGPAMVTGRASKGIARRLTRHEFRLLVEPQSFLVDKQNQLIDGEAERATAWGAAVATALATPAPVS
jgi:hypothetical protein